MESFYQSKTVVVTGGANGIGKDIALQFASVQADVIVWDCDKENGHLLESLHDHISFKHIDLSNARLIEEAFAGLAEIGVHVDILINNVGISKFKPLLELSTFEWDEVINVNLRCAFVCSREFAKQGVVNHYGRIVNIASTRHLMSEPNSEAYAASKGGLVSLTHALAVSLSGSGTTVNCISPGWIHTGNQTELSSVDHSQHPSGRVGTSKDISDLCLFLCRKESDFINGQNLYVDGGMTKKMIYHE